MEATIHILNNILHLFQWLFTRTEKTGRTGLSQVLFKLLYLKQFCSRVRGDSHQSPGPRGRSPTRGPSGLRVPGGLNGRRKAAVVQLPDVLLQIEVAAETFPAGGAGEGLFVVVRVHVKGEVVDLVKGLVADGALILFLSTVRQFVVLVVSCKDSNKQSRV